MSSTITVPRVANRLLPKDLADLFSEHCELICRTAYRITGSAQDAEDILQTIFLRLMRREFPPDVQKNPKAYLHRAAVNLSLDTLRARKTWAATVDIEGLENAVAAGDATLTEDALHERLWAAIAKLKPSSADILILRYVHNLSDAAIAKQLGKSRIGIAVNLSRSRARLRKIIKASLGE